MNTIVLAYSGGFASSNAVHWLTEKYPAAVVTVTLDVGQGDDLGAFSRAHVEHQMVARPVAQGDPHPGAAARLAYVTAGE